jgi:hypothetical protein
LTRDDELGELLQRYKKDSSGNVLVVHRDTASWLVQNGQGRMTGPEVSAAFGPLLHYTDPDGVRGILAASQIGFSGRGVWLTPVPYASCLAPYDLGLESPRNVCLVVDPEILPELYGPGTAAPSTSFGSIWRGGGVEFFSTTPVPLSAVRDIVEVSTCGTP